jgi:membrane protease YdiL (CAAX protease family)
MESTETATPLKAKAAGIILLIILVVLLLEGAVLNSVLDYLRKSSQGGFLQNASELELRGVRLIILSVLDPLVMFGTTILLLRKRFPAEDLRAITSRFGLRSTISLKIALTSFAVGSLYVVLFTEVLMDVFPPNEFAAPHPANVAASTPVWAQLMFAISASTIVPIVEEFFFRGVLYQGLSAQWNKIAGAIVVSLVFTMFHPDALRSGYWLTHLSLYLIPFALVIAREITGSLTSPIMVHSGFNFTEFFF